MRPVPPLNLLFGFFLSTLFLLGNTGVCSPISVAALGHGSRRLRSAAAVGDTEVLTSRLEALFREWKALPGNQVSARSPAIKDEIDEILVAYMIATLDKQPQPPAERIEQDLSGAQAIATWEAVFGISPPAARAALKTNPQHLSRIVRGDGSASGLYVAAFDIGYGNVFTTRVHGFSPAAGKYHEVKPTGELDGAVSGAMPLRAFDPHELRLVLWSLHIGSPEGLTTIVVYKLDKKQLRPLWLRPNIPAAEVALRQGLLIIESHSHRFVKNAPIFQYRREFYQQVPAGLKRVKVEKWIEH